MSKKRGLGQGVNALFSAGQMDEFNASVNEKGELVLNLDIRMISPSKTQPRKSFDDDRIEALAESIKEHGLLQPIIVRKQGAGFSIVAGERRLRAVKLLKEPKIRAILIDADEKTISQLALMENLQREDLNPLEEAQAYSYLMTEHNLTQAEVAVVAGKSRAQIANMVRLLTLNKDEKIALSQLRISTGIAKVLLSVKDPALRRAIFNTALSKDITVRQAEAMLAAASTPPTKRAEVKKDSTILSFRKRLQNIFSTKVDIKDNSGRGTIQITYANQEEMERILDMLFHVEQ